MVDRQSPLSLIFEEATRQYDKFFVESPRQGRRLTPKELEVYPLRTVVAGWRTELQAGDTWYEIDVVVDPDFPFSAPRIALLNKSKFLVWPHVERDGCLCLLTAHDSFKISTGTELIQYLLDEAAEVITAGQEETNHDEFASEFHSYWGYVVDHTYPIVWSLLAPGPPNRYVLCWRWKGFTLVGENERQLRDWLKNYFQEDKEVSRTFQKGAFFWFNRPLTPREYPKSNADFAALIKREGKETCEFFYKLLPFKEFSTLAIFGFETETGIALGGGWLKKPEENALHRGFRPKHAKKIMVLRCLDNRHNFSAVEVQRVDHKWIHTRGGKSEAEQLRDKAVALIGCGSVGSLVAHILAQSGVRRFLLLDPDSLSWDNVARHALGGDFVLQNKAEAVATFLSRNFPNVEIVNKHKEKWEKLYRENIDIFNKCDLVISTTGDWQSESALNFLNRNSANFPPVLYGWTEANACAGHALFVHDVGGCLACGMDEKGKFNFSVINWSGGDTLKAIPACGGLYQPYGIVDLMPIVSMIADLILKVLLGKICRSHLSTWIGQEHHYNDLGGHLTPYWSEYLGNEKTLGAKMIQQKWHINQDCHLCR